MSPPPRAWYSTLTHRSSALIVVGSLANALLLARMNARKAHRRAELLADAGAGEGDEKERGERAWAELGDRHPDFRYTL